MLKLLAKESRLSKQHLEILWSNCIARHEEIERATLEVVQELAAELPLDQLEFLCVKVNSVPVKEYDEKMVRFLKKFTLGCMTNINTDRPESGGFFQQTFSIFSRSKKVKDKDVTKYYQLDKFWAVWQEDSLAAQVKEAALKGLIELLDTEECPTEQPLKFLNFALENFKKVRSPC